MCQYEAPSALNISLGVFLIVRISISYIPQFVSIIRRGTSEGLSFPTIALAFLSGLLTLINTGILNWNPKVLCCMTHPLSECLAVNLSLIQLMIGPTSIFILYILFLRYFTFAPNEAQTRYERAREFRFATIIFAVVFVSAITLATVAGILYYDFGISSEVMVKYAQTCGGISSVVILFQWMPQIWTVFKLKSPGSLSVPMLALQAPGAILVIYFLAVLNKADFTTWAPYVVTFIEQVILIALCAFYHIQEKRAMEKSKVLNDIVTTVDEKQRLLAN